MNSYRYTFYVVVAICFLMTNGCSKQPAYSSKEKLSPPIATAVTESEAPSQSLDMNKSEMPPLKKARSKEAPAPSAPSVSDEVSPQDTPKDKTASIDLKQITIPSKNGAWERSLAYTMSLTYKCENFLDARKQLIAIVPRYGFLISSETSINEYSSSLSAVFKIRVDSLYDFINAIQSIGHLQYEQINGTDHTGDLFFAAL